MEQKLLTELRPLYTTTKQRPHEIRIRIRMRDLIDPEVLRRAVDTTMKRYPYFCVELNSAESNYHMIAFYWQENGIVYDLQDVNDLELANILLPWTE